MFFKNVNAIKDKEMLWKMFQTEEDKRDVSTKYNF